MKTIKLNDPEPDPTKNEFPAVWDLVFADIIERDKKGKEKYGTRLQAFNGRKPLIDAYQEALDLVVYLRQAIFEMDYIETKDKLHLRFDDLKCNCPTCQNIEKKIKVEPKEEYCTCPTNTIGAVLDKEGILRCWSCKKKLHWPSSGPEMVLWPSRKELKEFVVDSIMIEKEEGYCTCKTAIEIYLAADDVFRCRECKKQIGRACDK